jgi:hypothetical protein
VWSEEKQRHGTIGLVSSGQARLPPIRLLLLLLLVEAALSHSRRGLLLGIVATPVLAEPLGSALGRGASKLHGAAS